MKKVFKRVAIIAIALVMVGFGSVQAQTSFGVYASLNETSLNTGSDWKAGFQIGGVAEFGLNNAFSIQPGLLFATQGDKETESLLGYKVTAKINLLYIQAPINVQYRIHLAELNGKNLSLLLNAGPYFGYAVGGKIKAKVTDDGETSTETESISFGNGEDYDLKPLDIGLTTGVGIELHNYAIMLRINRGLMNISNSESFNNLSIGASVTYMF